MPDHRTHEGRQVNRRNVLESVADCEQLFGSLITNSVCTRRDVMRCVRAGLVKSVGPVTLMDDDDSPVEPERFREGFRLTEAGRQAARIIGLRI